ncbi:MAG TPA: TetR family transcriptional regulator C-terminal domain-containing protein [Trebonia sp.]|nr:TetR family transcriptional regulator C-terminal domain-containing protein [Trebonia sp.]
MARRLGAYLAQAREQGEVSDGLDIDLAAHQLLVLIDGLSAQRVLYAGRVTAERQRQMLDRLLGSFRPTSRP